MRQVARSKQQEQSSNQKYNFLANQKKAIIAKHKKGKDKFDKIYLNTFKWKMGGKNIVVYIR